MSEIKFHSNIQFFNTYMIYRVGYFLVVKYIMLIFNSVTYAYTVTCMECLDCDGMLRWNGVEIKETTPKE